jgi:transcriptional regulator with XRE-family HTH domain
MPSSQPSVELLLAARIRELRAERGYSLDQLAQRSGVSRSNISLIERGESSPTAAVLDKLASAVGVTLASLFETPSQVLPSPPSPVMRRAEQTIWKDPQSGYVRRHLSPLAPSPTQLVEVRFPAGQRVAYESAGPGTETYQQIWMLDGTMEITVGDASWTLQRGDCLSMRLDTFNVFHNSGSKEARYLVALTSPAVVSRKKP